jgi:hypothetical protein
VTDDISFIEGNNKLELIIDGSMNDFLRQEFDYLFSSHTENFNFSPLYDSFSCLRNSKKLHVSSNLICIFSCDISNLEQLSVIISDKKEFKNFVFDKSITANFKKLKTLLVCNKTTSFDLFSLGKDNWYENLKNIESITLHGIKIFKSKLETNNDLKKNVYNEIKNSSVNFRHLNISKCIIRKNK